MATATTVLLALRNASGHVVPGATAVMPMPAAWRTGHPATYTASDLHDWPVVVGDAAQAVAATLRFGSAGVGGGDCGGMWKAGGVYGGMICVDHPGSPAWGGWSSAFGTDTCSLVGEASDVCTEDLVFAMSVRNF